MHLDDRMKMYEHVFRRHLMRRVPVIIRIDGKAFHTFTKGMNRPFDYNLARAFWHATRASMQEFQGCSFAYHQSDEVSFLLVDYSKFDTQGWFDYNQSKIESIAASTFTAYFNHFLALDNLAKFDARAFNVPIEEVANYFVWRQQDWQRNSLQMLCRFHFSHKELDGKKTADMHDMLHDIGVNWVDLEPWQKDGSAFDSMEGRCLFTPQFKNDRYFIEQHVLLEEVMSEV